MQNTNPMIWRSPIVDNLLSIKIIPQFQVSFIQIKLNETISWVVMNNINSITYYCFIFKGFVQLLRNVF